MAWVAVNKNSTEGIFKFKPRRIPVSSLFYNFICKSEFWSDVNSIEEGNDDTEIELPKGTIKKLIGRELTWKDEPVELKEE